MINVRGVNVYPSAVESVVRRFDHVVEFRSTVRRTGAMRSLSLEIELVPDAVDALGIATHVSQQLREALGLTIPVHVVDTGTLPRFEMKARRLVVEE
jgi:phenylacetate-CoA ligase